MVNTEQFANRLNKILDYYDLSAASFADSIEVGRSSISHILSGRNKPSLDFVMKVVKNFPEVELYWLLNGKGKFPLTAISEQDKVPLQEKTIAPAENSREVISEEKVQSPVFPVTKSKNGKEIKRIVLFYTDGSFEAFEN